MASRRGLVSGRRRTLGTRRSGQSPIEVFNITRAREQAKQPFKIEEEARRSEAKLTEQREQRRVGAQQEVSGSLRFVRQFERSFDELDNELKNKLSSIPIVGPFLEQLPEFGEPGIGGATTRTLGTVAESFSGLPETSALLIRLKPIANQMARDVEGGRVTDQDRKIYADSFANTLKNPTPTNARLISEQLIGLADKGGDISKNLQAFSQSENPVFKQILENISEDFPELIPGNLGAQAPLPIQGMISRQPQRQDTSLLRQQANQAIQTEPQREQEIRRQFRAMTGEPL